MHTLVHPLFTLPARPFPPPSPRRSEALEARLQRHATSDRDAVDAATAQAARAAEALEVAVVELEGLREEHRALRSMGEAMMEAKDAEVSERTRAR